MIMITQLLGLCFLATGCHDPPVPGSSKSGLPTRFASLSMYSYWGLPKVDHYSTIGFKAVMSTEEQMENTKRFVSNPDTKMFPASTADYKMLHLPSKCGAELWGGVNPHSEFFGNDPHFAGPSRLRVKLTRKIEREYDEGLFQGWAMNPDDHDSEEEFMPLQFDFYCPTYQLWGKNLVLPITTTAQVAAFAHEIEIFDSIQDYHKFCEKERAEGKMIMADQSFGSTSLFSEDKEDEARKLSIAVFTGHVVRAELKVNERTGESFYWALVETLGGCQFDVVIHPLLVNPNHPPRSGCIIQGAFYLSGRLLPEEDM